MLLVYLLGVIMGIVHAEEPPLSDQRVVFQLKVCTLQFVQSVSSLMRKMSQRST